LLLEEAMAAAQEEAHAAAAKAADATRERDAAKRDAVAERAGAHHAARHWSRRARAVAFRGWERTIRLAAFAAAQSRDTEERDEHVAAVQAAAAAAADAAARRADQELALRQSPADGPKLLGLTFHRLALDSYRAVRSKLELELTTRAEELDVTVRGDPFG
jgi:hypothetical protein